MNITIIDFIKFIKKHLIFAIASMILFGSVYHYSSSKRVDQYVQTFELDLSVYENLRTNANSLINYNNYANFQELIKYKTYTVFESNIQCLKTSFIKAVLLCTSEGSKPGLEKKMLNLYSEMDIINERQKDKMKKDIKYFQLKLDGKKKYILNMEESSNSSDYYFNPMQAEVTEKILNFNLKVSMDIMSLERELLIIENFYRDVSNLVIVKNPKQSKIIKKHFLYTFISSLLGLLLFSVIGLAITTSRNVKKS